jgi:hypothetical protein
VKDQEFKVFTQFLEIERNIMIEMGLIKVWMKDKDAKKKNLSYKNHENQ